MLTLAVITINERECAYDDYDTESGQGMPDEVEPYEVDAIAITVDDVLDSPDKSLNDLIQSALDDAGCGQWDGSNVGYDPDGSHMAMDGTITERWCVIKRMGEDY